MTFILLRIVLQWLRKRACLAPVRETAGGLVFRAEGLKRCYSVFILISLGIIATVMYFRESPWWTALPLMLAVGCAAMWPADVVLNERELVQREWWGRTRRMPWSTVAAIVQRSRNGDTFVYDEQGRAICHSGCHAGQRRFRAEVMARSGIRHIAEWGAMPTFAIPGSPPAGEPEPATKMKAVGA